MAERKQEESQGRGWYGNSEGHAKAGRLGGLATAKGHDRSFYETIGANGGRRSSGSFKKGSDRAKEAGRRGGRRSRRKAS